MQAPLIDGFSFNPFALFEDGLCCTEIGADGEQLPFDERRVVWIRHVGKNYNSLRINLNG